ncbi:MAG: hypothetical protein KKF16_06755 [Euryarchaeota archaeon]|nr:hypothetical protein [Euryarchaeota archaeon]
MTETRDITFYGKEENAFSVILLEKTDTEKMAENVFKRLKGIVSVPCGEGDCFFPSRELLVEYLENVKKEIALLNNKKKGVDLFGSCRSEDLARFVFQ